MKTTLTKKLLKFFIPLLVIPMALMIVFYFTYLKHVIQSETISLSKHVLTEQNNLIERANTPKSRLQDYLQVDASLPEITIFDKKLTIIAGQHKQDLGKTYDQHRGILKSYVAEVLQNKNNNLFHFTQEEFLIKPLLSGDGKIIAFSVCDYKNDLDKKLTIIFQTFIFVFFIVILITFINIFLTIIFSFNMINPIKLLIKGTKKVSAGDLSDCVEATSDDEIGVLIDSFNEMVTKLRLSTAVFKNTQEAIMVTDEYSNILDVNEAFTDVTGYSKEEVLGKNPKILKSDRHDKSFYEALWNTLLADGSWQGNVWNRTKDGKIYPEWLNISSVKGSDGKIKNFIAVFSDITQLKENEKRLEFLAHHDVLTTLPNRLLLNARMEHSIDVCKRLGTYAGVCFLDLDNFKNINDNYGHDVGDEVLKEASRRLKTLLRADDTLARVGGDEFVFVFENLQKPDEMSSIAEKILACFQEPFIIEGKEFLLGGSLGISIYPDDGQTTTTLSKNADTAMYVVKDTGKNMYRYYNEEMSLLAMDRLTMEHALENGIKNEEFLVYYQPKYNLDSLSIEGLEALVRWQHPEKGLLSPNVFIPLAEETELIIPLGELVLRQACLDAVKWHEEGIFKGRIAVNVSGVQINKSDFIQTIRSILHETQATPEMIEIELTETIVMEDPEKWIKRLKEIKTIGLHISIDDFGTGYSSLNHLRRLPVDTLKIDQSFVKDLTEDSDADTIARAIISLAASMGMDTIAEGVETKQQKDFLISCGCHHHQGFLYARPQTNQDTYLLLQGAKHLDQERL